MNAASYGIMRVLKYECGSGAETPSRVTTERLVPMLNNDTPIDNLIPYGYCECGCGQKTRIATQSDSAKGWTKGTPVRFRSGHHSRVVAPSDFVWSESDGCFHVTLYSDRYPGQYAMVSREDIGSVQGKRWIPHLSSNGKLYAGHGRRTWKMHRLIMDAPAGMDVDHINGDTLDNRRENLRLCTRSQNVANADGLCASNTSGFHGVSYRGRTGKWAVQLRVEKDRVLYASTFLCPVEAAIFRDVAALECLGEFASLNFDQLRGLFSPDADAVAKAKDADNG